MKFIVNCPELKKAMDRAISVISKNSTLDILQCVHIKTDDRALLILATNADQFIKVTVQAKILMPGECFIHMDDIKKVYNFSDIVIVEKIDEKLVVKNSKKKSAIAIRNHDETDLLQFPDMENEKLFMEISGSEFTNTLAALSVFVSDNNANALMSGYNLDGSKCRAATLDGHRFTYRRLQECFKSDDNVTIPFAVYTILKKIKIKSNFKIYVDNKYILICGENCELWSKLINGKFFDLDSFVPRASDFTLEVDAAELKKISKEYGNILKNDNRPMYFMHINGVLYFGLMVADYITVDVIDSFNKGKSEGLNKDFIYGFDPKFISDAMGLYKNNVICKGNGQKSPIFFDDGEYFTCILPKVVSVDSLEKFSQFINFA